MTSESDYEPSEEEEEERAGRGRADEPDISMDEFNGMSTRFYFAAMIRNSRVSNFNLHVQTTTMGSLGRVRKVMRMAKMTKMMYQTF